MKMSYSTHKMLSRQSSRLYSINAIQYRWHFWCMCPAMNCMNDYYCFKNNYFITIAMNASCSIAQYKFTSLTIRMTIVFTSVNRSTTSIARFGSWKKNTRCLRRKKRITYDPSKCTAFVRSIRVHKMLHNAHSYIHHLRNMQHRY